MSGWIQAPMQQNTISSQIEINHVIDQPTAKKFKKWCALSTAVPRAKCFTIKSPNGLFFDVNSPKTREWVL